jgi:hypothetical protein
VGCGLWVVGCVIGRRQSVGGSSAGSAAAASGSAAAGSSTKLRADGVDKRLILNLQVRKQQIPPPAAASATATATATSSASSASSAAAAEAGSALPATDPSLAALQAHIQTLTEYVRCRALLCTAVRCCALLRAAVLIRL